MSDDDRLIRIRLTGSRTGQGAIDFDALLAFGENFRRALRATSRERQGSEPVLAGHPTNADEQASSLRLVALAEGSVVLVMEPTTLELFAPVTDAVGQLGWGVGQRRLSEAVHRSLSAAVKSLGDGGSMEVSGPGITAFQLDGARLELIEPGPAEPDQHLPPHVDGWLHAVDLAPDEIRVRDSTGADWICRFDSPLEPVVRSLLGSQVRVTGLASAMGARRRIEATSVTPLAPEGLGRVGVGLSSDDVIAHAMAEAGIDAPQSVADLRMDLDESDPEVLAFFEAIESLG